MSNDTNVLLLPGKGDATYDAPISFAMGHKVSSLMLIDFDNDGRLDFIYQDRANTQVRLLLNKQL